MSGLFAAGDAPTSHVSLHVLLTYFQTDGLALATDGLLVLAALGYVALTRRLSSQRGRRWPVWQTACWCAGLFAIFIAVGSGLAAYDGNNLSAHVIQHMFLMMIAPPLFALARPLTLLAQASSRSVQVRTIAFINSEPLKFLSGPFSWVLYYGSMWIFFLSPLYKYTDDHPLAHDFSHVAFVAIGYLFWQGVVGLDGAGHRVSHGLRLGALFLGMPLESFLGITLMNMAKPIAPGFSLGDTHAGGSVFWVSSMFVMAIAIIISVAQWMKSEERSAARVDAQLDRHAALGEPQLTPEDEARLHALVAPGAAGWRKPPRGSES